MANGAGVDGHWQPRTFALMQALPQLFERNRRWAARRHADDPDFFARLARQQSPEYLWIGCSDSRVPANEIIGLDPGEVFVHRNVANVVVHTDLNCLSVLQFAVDVLRVRHVIVCGHYGCGGVQAALSNRPYGLIDNWLRNIKDVCLRHQDELSAIPEGTARLDRACELNVAQQVANVCHTTIAQDAWRRNQPLTVHGWIYGLTDGLLRDLGFGVSEPTQLPDLYRMTP